MKITTFRNFFDFLYGSENQFRGKMYVKPIPNPAYAPFSGENIPFWVESRLKDYAEFIEKVLFCWRFRAV